MASLLAKTEPIEIIMNSWIGGVWRWIFSGWVGWGGEKAVWSLGGGGGGGGGGRGK